MLKPKGNRGTWFAKWEDTWLPCVHEHWIDGQSYNDPGCIPDEGKWPKFIEAIKNGKQVIVTRSKVTGAPQNKSGVSMDRQDYLSIWEVSNVQADDESLRFDFRRKLKDFT